MPPGYKFVAREPLRLQLSQIIQFFIRASVKKPQGKYARIHATEYLIDPVKGEIVIFITDRFYKE